MLDFLIGFLIVGLLILVMRGVLVLREVDQRIESNRIKAYRIERVSRNRVLVFDGKSHDERKPYYVVDLIDDIPQSEEPSQPSRDKQVVYMVDATRPDDKRRRLLLDIVRLSIRKFGAQSGLIVSANLSKSEKLCDEPDWQGAIDYGVSMFGVKTEKRKSTYCGAPYLTLTDLEDAICRYAVVSPTPTDTDAETANNTGNNSPNSKYNRNV